VITGVTGHVLQIDGAGEVIADDRHDVLRGAIVRADNLAHVMPPGDIR
jgi:hypothetical protein